MIRLAMAAEPAGFDSTVRQPGLSAIAELVGRPPLVKRPGRRRKKVASRRDRIPPDAFPPYWRNALPDLLRSYSRLCAFLALYIEQATGDATVDHMVPKSRQWDQVYEWRNYRLAAGLINSKKNDLTGLIDPIDVRDGWFALEFVGHQVVVGQRAPKAKRAAIARTIRELGLNLQPCRDQREEYVDEYLGRRIRLSYLERRAPFVARELRRQHMLLPGDV